MQHPGEPPATKLRFVRLDRHLVVVFGASELMTPTRLRMFHLDGNRFIGVAYRIEPRPEGGENWFPGPVGDADLADAAGHIPSLHLLERGPPTILSMDDADLARVSSLAREPRRRTVPWREVLKQGRLGEIPG